MADRIDYVTERVDRVETKVDTLSTTVNTLSVTVQAMDTRLSGAIETLSQEVSEGLAEQRRYAGCVRQARDEGWTPASRREVDVNAARLEGKMDTGFEQIERKLDQFIDTQLQTNQLMDRRLRLLEE